MKTINLFVMAIMAAVIVASGTDSACAQEKIRRNIMNSKGELNKEVMTGAELEYLKILEKPFDKRTAADRYENDRLSLLSFDNIYLDDNGYQRTRLTREDLHNNGFPEFVYEMLVVGLDMINEMNDNMKVSKEDRQKA